ncbi:hypothetical protein ACFQ1E_17330 [Sphingomonas canadensis]|uniref:Gene transfer agent family protein n=1 Tax=Sphingomonas canadensis TaxID=1219257 RepID=A0ABW3HA31_9SPHN|nr:hypothetical protein [Sphingomonas canadensis]MCW3837810.1 hypothetical protein [Sphingomonas canadensis]
MAVGLMGEATCQLDGKHFHLVMDNEAWMLVEDVLDRNYLDIVATIWRLAQRRRLAPVSMMRAIIWGATRRNHPELSIEDCQKLAENPDPEFSRALSQAFWGSVATSEPGEEAPDPGEAKARREGRGAKAKKAKAGAG